VERRTRIQAPDGRALEILSDGPEDGDLVFLHLGTPSAAELFGPHVEAGASRGLRHVTYSRPGYGDSDRVEHRAVADCVAHVAAIADAMGAERFYVTGWSGGGPHVLATAALLADRVLAASTMGGVAPVDATGLDWLAGMGDENMEEFEAMKAGPEALEAYLIPEAEKMEKVTTEDVSASLGDLVSAADHEALTGAYGPYAVAGMRRAVRQGIWGWFDDDAELMAPWGFELDAIAVPVTVWQGGQDRFVPPAHAEWLAATIPGATLRLLPDEGHLSIKITEYGNALDDLIERGTAR
jgi:pimeloyl-ACP methyl ester carboxylesterase